MKKEKDEHQKGIYDVRQNTEKVRNNGTFGFMGSKTSGMGCMALAATICMLGRWQNLCNMFFIQIPELYWQAITAENLPRTFPIQLQHAVTMHFALPESSVSQAELSISQAEPSHAFPDQTETKLTLEPRLYSSTTHPMRQFSMTKTSKNTSAAPSLNFCFGETTSNSEFHLEEMKSFPLPPDAVCAGQHLCIFLARHPERVPRCGPNGWGKMIGGVSYGDTDSTFVRWQAPLHLNTREEILAFICEKTTRCRNFVVNLFPPPTNSEFEALKFPILLTGNKKQHGSKAYKEARLDTVPELSYKGLSFLKRDRCTFVQRAGLDIFSLVLDVAEQVPFNTKVIWDRFCKIVQSFVQQPTNHDELKDYIISIQIKSLADYDKPNVVGYQLSNLILAERGSLPRPGTRALYAMAYFQDGRDRCRCVVTEKDFLKHKRRLDVAWYLTVQL